MDRRRNKNVHAPMVTYIVPGSNTALVSSGTALVGSGNALNITNGVLGVLSKDFDGTILANVFKGTQDATAVKAVSLIQGTPNSAQLDQVHPAGIGHKAYIEGGTIRAGNILHVSNSKYDPGIYNSELFTDLANVALDTNYAMYVDLDSSKRRRYFGRFNKDTQTVTGTVPTGTTNEEGYLIGLFAHKLNHMSNRTIGNRPFVAFAVDSQGAGSGTTIAGLDVGDTIPFVIINGVTYSITVDKPMARVLQALWTEFNDAMIIAVDPDALDLAECDAMLVVGLDEPLALLEDEVKQRKVTVRSTISKPDGTTTDYTHAVLTQTVEEKNSGRSLALDFNERARRQQFAQDGVELLGPKLQAPTYIDEDAIYNVVTIEYLDGEQLITGVSHEPKVVHVLILADDASVYIVGDEEYAITINNSYTTVATGLNNNFAAWVKSSETYHPINYSLEYGAENAFF